LCAKVGAVGLPYVQRALLAVAAALVVAVPLPSLRASSAAEATDPDPRSESRLHPNDVQDPDHRRADRFTDPDAGVTIVPPSGWVRSPATSLNPESDPPEPVQEVARFQIRVGDVELYATPIPITSGLVADATAIISIGVARVGSDVLTLGRGVRGSREVGGVPGFTTLDDEATYEGLHVLTRYLFSRDTDRVLVVRAAAAENAWTDYEGILRASLATFTGDPKGSNAPAPPPPPPPPSVPARAEPAPDQTVALRNGFLARAASLIGLRYVWGGNSTTNGMDCSAYVSWVWGTSRWSTDSIWNVSFPITKADLRPGDALNLTTGRDPRRLGHIRLFEAWANTERSAMWVYEETPPRAVHRVVAYDDRYQPIRLAGLSGAGEVQLIPGKVQPSAAPAPTRRPGATPVPTRRPPIASASASPVRTPTPQPTVNGPFAPTPTPIPSPTRTLSPTVPPTPRP
jgi:hypothetical protein